MFNYQLIISGIRTLLVDGKVIQAYDKLGEFAKINNIDHNEYVDRQLNLSSTL
jgi:hypothetical protein